MITFKKLLPLLLALLPAAPAFAEVTSLMEAFQVVRDKEGREQFAEAKAARPGDLIEYRLTYSNTEATPVNGLLVKGPVPAGTQYIDSSARSLKQASVRFSSDGGASWQPAPLKRRGADGKEVIVPPEQYTHVQWTSALPLEKGKPQRFIYRVRVAEQAAR